jgi:hypothetical protein
MHIILDFDVAMLDFIGLSLIGTPDPLLDVFNITTCICDKSLLVIFDRVVVFFSYCSCKSLTTVTDSDISSER